MTSHGFTYTDKDGRRIRAMGHACCKECGEGLWRKPYWDGEKWSSTGSMPSHPGDRSEGALCRECATSLGYDVTGQTVKDAMTKLNVALMSEINPENI